MLGLMQLMADEWRCHDHFNQETLQHQGVTCSLDNGWFVDCPHFHGLLGKRQEVNLM